MIVLIMPVSLDNKL